MLRSTFLSSARPVFAAVQDNAAEASASRRRQTANADKPTETGPKVVYLRPNDTAADILVRIESFAEAGIRFLSSVVVHMVVRTYSPIDADRVSDTKTLMNEVEGIIQEYAKGKRGGKPFEHAWTSRIIATARAMGVKLLSDGKKGVAGPVSEILRCRTVDKANEIVFQHCLAVTKGSNSFTALTKALTPKKPKAGAQTGKTSNATKPAVGSAKAVALRLMSETGHEVFNATPGKNAVAKAEKLAGSIGKSNIDHKTFVLRSLESIDSPEALMEIAERAQELARALVAKASNVAGEGIEKVAAAG